MLYFSMAKVFAEGVRGRSLFQKASSPQSHPRRKFFAGVLGGAFSKADLSQAPNHDFASAAEHRRFGASPKTAKLEKASPPKKHPPENLRRTTPSPKLYFHRNLLDFRLFYQLCSVIEIHIQYSICIAHTLQIRGLFRPQLISWCNYPMQKTRANFGLFC